MTDGAWGHGPFFYSFPRNQEFLGWGFNAGILNRVYWRFGLVSTSGDFEPQPDPTRGKKIKIFVGFPLLYSAAT